MVVGTRFYQVAFSGNGAIITAHFGSPALAFFRSIDGGLISSMKYLTIDTTSMIITGYRTFKLSSDAVPKVYLSNEIIANISGGFGYQIYGLTMGSASTTWAMKSNSSAVGTIKTVTFGESESIIYVLG